MKILLVSPLPPPAGGIATWTKTYCAYCSDNGHDIRVVNTAILGKRSNNKKLYLLDEIVRTFRILTDMRKQLRRREFDVVHLNSSCSKLGLLRDAGCLWLAGSRKTVFHCHCNIADQVGSGRMAQKLLKFAVKRADKVFVLNQKSWEYLAELGRKDAQIVPNFIEASTLCDTHIIREEIKRIVYVGHVQRTKGIFELIEVAAQLPDIAFQVVGPVYEDFSGVKLPDNVDLLGLKSKNQVLELLRDADVFLFPSYSEGFSVALLEAMACGVPVIASDVGANADMIEDKGGIIIPARDSDAIVGAVKQLAAPEIREEQSNWNRQKVTDCYLTNNVIDGILKLYY